MLQFQNGNTTSYQYSNDGVKRKVTHQTAIANVVIPMGSIQPLSTGQIAYTSTTDYCGNVIYEDGILSKVLTSEGYITLSGTTPTYYYYLKDHLGNNRVVIDQNGSVEQVNHYYPFGGLFGEGTSNTNQAYKYNGKELDRMHGLDWYDYGARNYDAALPVWTTVDPLAEKYYNSSPYAYCANNPIRYIDPDGRNPIYADDGSLLGTDDNGLQGNAIIMNKDNFKQGMSYDDAMKHNLGVEGLADQDAIDRYTASFEGLKDRPDWDGYLTLDEANDWYQNGNGQSLFVALDKIDLSGIVSLGEKFVGDKKNFNLLLNSNSLNDGLVYGQISLKRYPNHTARAYADEYNFEQHSWWNPLNWGRNIETAIGSKYAGQGTKYEINIYGSKKLTPILPWIK